MDLYVTGAAIKRIREEKKITQVELAARIDVSSKAVSKGETAKGLPDISLIEPLAEALGISVMELMSGDQVINKNKAANMMRSKFYVCTVCENVIHTMGETVVSCCGVPPEYERERLAVPILQQTRPYEAESLTFLLK